MSRNLVSGHSGLPEDVELKQMEEKANQNKKKRDEQMAIVCKVLDTMPPDIRRRFLLTLIKKYEG